MKVQWIREGFSSYYVVEKQQELTYEKDILLCHTMECMIPCEFRLQEETEYYYFETGIYVPYFERINELEPKDFFYQCMLAMEEMEGYLLDLDHLQITEKLVMLREQKYPVFCYLPEYEKNIFEQIREFLEMCMEQISYEDKKRVRFFYEFHGFLVKEKPNLHQIKEYLKPEEVENRQEIYIPNEEMEICDTEEPIELEPNRRKIGGLLFASFCFVGCTAFFGAKIYQYGLVYQFVCGALLSVLFFGSIVFLLMKEIQSYKYQNPLILEEEGTQLLLEDDEKTMLLEQPIGKLISCSKEKEDILVMENGFVIGSSEKGTDYQLISIGVSRRHMEIFMKQETIYLKDLLSTNGTWVNGRKIEEHCLKDGDIVKIGREEFEFRL